MPVSEQKPGTLDWLLYGATGYTGELIAQAALEADLRPTLAGRNETAVASLATRLGLKWRAFDLENSQVVADAIAGHTLVLHCAGPFTRTSPPMVEACLNKGIHYLDITGESPVFRSVYAQTEEARQKGVLLVPGVGCDVVPSSCLASSLHTALPDANRLELACVLSTQPSRGTLKTVIERLSDGVLIVRNGEFVTIRHGQEVRQLPINKHRQWAIAAPFSDLVAAHQDTGIPEITAYLGAPWMAAMAARTLGWSLPFLAVPPMRILVELAIKLRPPGPSAPVRSQGYLRWWGRVHNQGGVQVSCTIDIIEPYSFTVMAALEAVRRVLAGTGKAGALTPAEAFGVDFAADVPGTRIGTLFKETA